MLHAALPVFRRKQNAEERSGSSSSSSIVLVVVIIIIIMMTQTRPPFYLDPEKVYDTTASGVSPLLDWDELKFECEHIKTRERNSELGRIISESALGLFHGIGIYALSGLMTEGKAHFVSFRYAGEYSHGALIFVATSGVAILCDYRALSDKCTLPSVPQRLLASACRALKISYMFHMSPSADARVIDMLDDLMKSEETADCVRAIKTFDRVDGTPYATTFCSCLSDPQKLHPWLHPTGLRRRVALNGSVFDMQEVVVQNPGSPACTLGLLGGGGIHTGVYFDVFVQRWLDPSIHEFVSPPSYTAEAPNLCLVPLSGKLLTIIDGARLAERMLPIPRSPFSEHLGLAIAKAWQPSGVNTKHKEGGSAWDMRALWPQLFTSSILPHL